MDANAHVSFMTDLLNPPQICNRIPPTRDNMTLGQLVGHVTKAASPQQSM
jgi:hypothetical protein